MVATERELKNMKHPYQKITGDLTQTRKPLAYCSTPATSLPNLANTLSASVFKCA